MRSLNGAFESKSSNPALADVYASILDTSFYGCEHDRVNLRNDMAIFGSDFKEATRKAKEEVKIEE